MGYKLHITPKGQPIPKGAMPIAFKTPSKINPGYQTPSKTNGLQLAQGYAAKKKALASNLA